MSAIMLPLYGPVARRRPTAETYRRRRLAALALAGMVVLAGVLAVRALGVAPLSVTGRHAPGISATPATPAASATAAPKAVRIRVQPVAETSYVVQPGDTLWSIARHLQPDGDVRPVVDRLAAQLHGHPLDAGQRLVLPSLPLGGR